MAQFKSNELWKPNNPLEVVKEQEFDYFSTIIILIRGLRTIIFLPSYDLDKNILL